MLGEISLWVKQIVMVVMFAAFIDFFIPENNFLRYVKVFLGFLVMIVIINPLASFFGGDFSINEIPLFDEKIADYNNIISKTGTLTESNMKLTIAEYKKNIENYISQKIAELTTHDVKNVTAKVEEDFSSDNFGVITEVEITLALPGKSKKSSFIRDKISIEKVKINGNLLESGAFEDKPQKEYTEILNFLRATFNIPEEKIYINLED